MVVEDVLLVVELVVVVLHGTVTVFGGTIPVSRHQYCEIAQFLPLRIILQEQSVFTASFFWHLADESIHSYGFPWHFLLHFAAAVLVVHLVVVGFVVLVVGGG